MEPRDARIIGGIITLKGKGFDDNAYIDVNGREATIIS